MRLTAPEMAERMRDGLVAEGAHVVDAGQVGTEMLYFLVGSRDLDGGADGDRLAQPQGLHGGEARQAGRDRALRRRRDRRRPRPDRGQGLGDAPGGGSVEEVEILETFQSRAVEFIDPDVVKPLRVVVDGGNGMPARWSARCSSALRHGTSSTTY